MLRDPPTLTTPKEERRQLARQALQRLLALMELNMEYESHFLDMKGVHGLTKATPVSANDGFNILTDDQHPNGTASVTRINDDLNKLDQLRAERRNCNRDSSPRSQRCSNNDMAGKI